MISNHLWNKYTHITPNLKLQIYLRKKIQTKNSYVKKPTYSINKFLNIILVSNNY